MSQSFLKQDVNRRYATNLFQLGRIQEALIEIYKLLTLEPDHEYGQELLRIIETMSTIKEGVIENSRI